MRDMAIRLRPVCADWPDDLFNAMIERLADVTLKFEGTSSPSTYDRRSTDRLVDDLRDALERNEEARGDRPETD
jgi:hypothetical protein